jgi:hypothetical protein
VSLSEKVLAKGATASPVQSKDFPFTQILPYAFDSIQADLLNLEESKEMPKVSDLPAGASSNTKALKKLFDKPVKQYKPKYYSEEFDIVQPKAPPVGESMEKVTGRKESSTWYSAKDMTDIEEYI